MSLSTAKARVMFARDYLQRNVDDVEPMLREAEGFLAEVDDEEKAPVLAEIAEIRAELESLPTGDETNAMSGAKGKISQARTAIERYADPTEFAEEVLAQAEEYLQSIREKFRDPFLDQIAEIRQQLAGTAPARAPETAEAAAESPAPVDPHRNVSQAYTRVVQARSLVESRRTENVEYVLQEALDLLAPVPDGQKEELLSQIDQIRAQMEGADKAETIRKVELMLDVELSGVSSNIEFRFVDARRGLERFHEKFSRQDAAVLPASTIERYRTRAAELEVQLNANVKADAMGRAESNLRELEEQLETNPLEGLNQNDAYEVNNRLRSLKDRVLDQLNKLSAEDPDVIAAQGRLAASDQRLEEFSAAWGRAALHAEVTTHWNATKQSIDGWQAESVDAARATLYSPSLPGTQEAARQLRFFLRDAETTRAENPDDAVVQAVHREADEMYAEVIAKLNTGFERILDLAEAMPTPLQESDHVQTIHLASAAENMLEGSRYQEPMRARIEALGARWKREYEEVIEGRKALYQQMSVEAEAAWPGIVAATGATIDWDPSDPGAGGKTVLLTAVYNRVGWEWTAREYGFAAKHQGVVLGGVYEPHVLKALEHAWYELKLDVNDRITWDIIAVVDGPGQIGERTSRTVKGADGLEIRKLEEWPAVSCLRLRIIGLHAGPVAVGP